MNTTPDIVSKIKKLENEFKTSEKKVAELILSDLEWAGKASIQELAKRAGVSEASVTRFAKAVDCKDVRALKQALVSSFAIGQRFIEGHVDPINHESGAIGQVIQGILQALQKVREQCSQAKILASAEAIHESRKLVIFGSGGGASIIAKDCANRLFRFGIEVNTYEDHLMQRMIASTLDSSATVLVISTTGHIKELNDNAFIAKEYGAKVIAITRNDSPLAKLADIHLQVHIQEDEGIMKATASRYGLLAVVDAIALEVGMLRKDTSKETLRRIKYNLDQLRGEDKRFPLGD